MCAAQRLASGVPKKSEMEEDIVAGLTRQVKEEVIERYLNERHIIGLQQEEFQEGLRQTAECAKKTGEHLSRMAFLTLHPGTTQQLASILQLPPSSPWRHWLQLEPPKGMCPLHVSGLTEKRKYRKLMLEAYRQLYGQTAAYRKKHEELQALCRAININITNFQKNFDLLAILRFLRSLDTQALERKHFLGENFTAEEMASLDVKLQIRTIDFDKQEIPAPLFLPSPPSIEHRLVSLASEIYGKHQNEVRRIVLSTAPRK